MPIFNENTSSRRVTSNEAADYLGLAESTLNKMRLTGAGPRYLKITARRVAYDTADLDAWLASKRRRSTSDQGAVAAA